MDGRVVPEPQFPVIPSTPPRFLPLGRRDPRCLLHTGGLFPFIAFYDKVPDAVGFALRVRFAPSRNGALGAGASRPRTFHLIPPRLCLFGLPVNKQRLPVGRGCRLGRRHESLQSTRGVFLYVYGIMCYFNVMNVVLWGSLASQGPSPKVVIR